MSPSRRCTLLVFVSVLTSLSACGGSDDPPPREITAVTFNAGLAPGLVPFSAERKEQTIAAIAAIDADVVCLQELWETQGDVDEAARSQFDASYFPDAEPSEEQGECGLSDLEGLQMCLRACEGQQGLALLGCLTTQCQETIPSEDCTGCLLANITGGIEGVYEECTEYAYGGSYGLGLLARGEIRDAELRPYDAVFARRGVLYATVEHEGVDWDVFCTHTTAAFPQLPYPGMADSWEDELATQVDEILAYVDEKHEDGRPILLLGDFNTGPKTAKADAELEQYYERITAAGFESLYVDQVGECTDCETNPLKLEPLGGASDESTLVDHVFTRGLSGEAERILDEAITIDVEGEEQESAYSDHYGVRVRVSN